VACVAGQLEGVEEEEGGQTSCQDEVPEGVEGLEKVVREV
jgi:hypothetical protein